MSDEVEVISIEQTTKAAEQYYIPATQSTPLVYKAIRNVSKELLDGIKPEKANGVSWKIRTIEHVYNRVAPLLVANKLVIVPRVLEKTIKECTTSGGKPSFLSCVTVEYTIIHVEDGSKQQIVITGDAQNNSDKGTAAALSMAYKYMCFQLFCIPMEDVSKDLRLYDTEHDNEEIRHLSKESHTQDYRNIEKFEKKSLELFDLLELAKISGISNEALLGYAQKADPNIQDLAELTDEQIERFHNFIVRKNREKIATKEGVKNV